MDPCDFIGIQREDAAKKRETAQEIADFLIEQGYCRTSGNSRGVSRIDRENWRKHLPRHIAKQLDGSAEDHYRRVHSRSHMRRLPREVWRLMPSSNFNRTGFKPLLP